MDGEAGWWTTSGNIGLPPLARAMGVGRQQQHGCEDGREDVCEDGCEVVVRVALRVILRIVVRMVVRML